MDKLQQRLIAFFHESITKALKVRVAKKSVILYQQKEGNWVVVARFSLDDGADDAKHLAEVCKDALVKRRVNAEMEKLEDKKESVQNTPGNSMPKEASPVIAGLAQELSRQTRS